MILLLWMKPTASGAPPADPVAMNPTVRATFKPATVVRTLNA